MISLKNLTIKQKDKLLINHLSCQFKKNEIWAIIGQNGVGKSTLLHTLAGLQDDFSGEIKLNDNVINKLSVLKRAQNIAILPQSNEANLDCTVKQSISYARYPWHNQNQQANTEKTIIDNALELMELNELQNKSIHQLSGGEQQRLEIATVFAQDSEIMLLDEPFNHLDLVFRYKLMQKLLSLKKDKTIIISTHDLSYINHFCSHVMLLIDADNIKCGTVNQVLTKENLSLMLGEELAQQQINLLSQISTIV